MLLCVDADAAARARTAEALRVSGFEVAEAGSVADARDQLDDGVTALVTEHELPDGTGLDLVASARERVPDTTCVLFTEAGLDEIDTEAFGDLVAEYLPKDTPDARSELVDLIEHSVTLGSQTAYPLPENEAARVAALERFAVDAEALGESFDRLTEVATELFGVNAAAVGIIDAHEQRFLACHGIAFDPVDREDTVCTYAILDDDVTVIEDTRADPRFEDNEGLRAANIRFYASVPLRTPAGEAIGTFCIYDDEPRAFPARQRELLSMLGEEAMDQLTLRHRLRTGGEADD